MKRVFLTLFTFLLFCTFVFGQRVSYIDSMTKRTEYSGKPIVYVERGNLSESEYLLLTDNLSKLTLIELTTDVDKAQWVIKSGVEIRQRTLDKNNDSLLKSLGAKTRDTNDFFTFNIIDVENEGEKVLQEYTALKNELSDFGKAVKGLISGLSADLIRERF